MKVKNDRYKLKKCVRLLVLAYFELNSIRARDGVPSSDVDEKYFSQLIDEIDDTVLFITGKSAHCHPALYDKEFEF